MAVTIVNNDQAIDLEKERQIKRSAHTLQKITGVKYTKARRYVEENITETAHGFHVHLFSAYGPPYQAEGELIYRLRCVFCGGNTFAFTP